MPRIFRGVLVALAAVAVGLSGCTTQSPPSPQTITWPQEATGGGRLLLVGSGSTLYAVWGDHAAVLEGPEARPTATPVPVPGGGESHIADRVQRIILDTSGVPWLVRNDQRVTTFAGEEAHPASAAVAKLATGSVTTASGRVVSDRLVADEGQTVIDATTVLASTFTGVRIANPAKDLILHRVTALTDTDLAGRWQTNPPKTVYRMPVGTTVNATAIDLGPVHGVAALSSDRVAIIVGDSRATGGAESRAALAVVEGGLLRRVDLPALCPTPNDVSIVRVTDRQVLIGAPAVSAQGECPALSWSRTWLRVDVIDGTTATLGTGVQNVAVVGDRVVTATTTQSGRAWTTTFTWGP